MLLNETPEQQAPALPLKPSFGTQHSFVLFSPLYSRRGFPCSRHMRARRRRTPSSSDRRTFRSHSILLCTAASASRCSCRNAWRRRTPGSSTGSRWGCCNRRSRRRRTLSPSMPTCSPHRRPLRRMRSRLCRPGKRRRANSSPRRTSRETSQRDGRREARSSADRRRSGDALPREDRPHRRGARRPRQRGNDAAPR